MQQPNPTVSLPPTAAEQPPTPGAMPNLTTPAPVPTSQRETTPFRLQRETVRPPSQRTHRQQREQPSVPNTPPSTRLHNEEPANDNRRSTRLRAKPRVDYNETRMRKATSYVAMYTVYGIMSYTAGAAYLAANHVLEMARDTTGVHSAYAALQAFDETNKTFDYLNPLAFAAATRASKKGNDPDFPQYHQAMASPEAAYWKEAMDVEIQELIKIGTWELVSRQEALASGRKIVKSTWAFRLKRLPDGTPKKYKARFCVRGDTQVAVEDYDADGIYSPVVQWSSVRLMLILSIVHGLHTRQVDAVNAFAQADLLMCLCIWNSQRDTPTTTMLTVF